MDNAAQTQVEAENRRVRALLRCAWAADGGGAAVTVHLPRRSFAWELPDFERSRKLGWKVVVLDQCRFGNEYRASMGLWSNHGWLGSCALSCECRGPHPIARGRVEVGGVKKSAAKVARLFPEKLRQELVGAWDRGV